MRLFRSAWPDRLFARALRPLSLSDRDASTTRPDICGVVAGSRPLRTEPDPDPVAGPSRCVPGSQHTIDSSDAMASVPMFLQMHAQRYSVDSRYVARWARLGGSRCPETTASRPRVRAHGPPPP